MEQCLVGKGRCLHNDHYHTMQHGWYRVVGSLSVWRPLPTKLVCRWQVPVTRIQNLAVALGIQELHMHSELLILSSLQNQ